MGEKPKGHFVFGWKVIAYLFLAGVGGGASAVGAAFHLIHPEAEFVTRASVILGAPLVVIGCLLLFSDLGRPQAAFRALSRPNQAWISRGTIILTAFIILEAIQFAWWIWPFKGLTSDSSLFTLLNVLGGIFGALTVIYTGFLFDTTRSIPFWSTPILPLLFLVSGVSTGILGLILLLLLSGVSPSESISLLSQFDTFLILFEALILFFYLHGMHEVTAARASVRRLVRGDLSAAFWGGVVLIGLVIPFVFEALWGSGFFMILIACLCGLAGGIYVRYVVVSGAVKAPLSAAGVLIYLSPRPE
ncbi:MAG: NrfD/PsrC family molybdoenzyme membrane anchor subunit [Thermodesulfobacteriota bacterium]